jgi:hypothetical protein
VRRLAISSSLTRSRNRTMVTRWSPPDRSTSAISRASCSSRDSAGQYRQARPCFSRRSTPLPCRMFITVITVV